MNIKNNQTNASKNLGKLPIWNLKDLYLSQNDKGLSRDLNNIKTNTLKFEKKYLNKVKTLSAENLYKAINQLEQLDILMDKVLSYAHLLVAEDGNNEKNKIFYQQMQEKITNYASSSANDSNLWLLNFLAFRFGFCPSPGTSEEGGRFLTLFRVEKSR